MCIIESNFERVISTSAYIIALEIHKCRISRQAKKKVRPLCYSEREVGATEIIHKRSRGRLGADSLGIETDSVENAGGAEHASETAERSKRAKGSA